ncbi:hypothetical protein STEG23_024927 [Scotinomys teguina]
MKEEEEEEEEEEEGINFKKAQRKEVYNCFRRGLKTRTVNRIRHPVYKSGLEKPDQNQIPALSCMLTAQLIMDQQKPRAEVDLSQEPATARLECTLSAEQTCMHIWHFSHGNSQTLSALAPDGKFHILVQPKHSSSVNPYDMPGLLCPGDVYETASDVECTVSVLHSSKPSHNQLD